MMMFDPETVSLSVAVLEACRGRSIMLATAESCTGGLIAAALTEIAGSSDVVDRGFVTYSNDAKTAMLGVAPALLAEHGAVSEAVALAMAEGALAASRAGIALAVTGIAGPGGGSVAKPVGRVHLAAALAGGPTLHVQLDLGDIGRGPIRIATVKRALRLALEALEA